MNIDESTGEIIPANIMPLIDKAPAIFLDVGEVEIYHNNPMKLVEKINSQAGYIVFDVQNKKERDSCRAHVAKIIKCIAPACQESKRLASEAKKVINQDIHFRKTFEAGIREIAEYHRKPLTEWEIGLEMKAEKARLEAEKIENERIYLLNWDDAIELNELFDLRREKAIREAEIEAIEKLREQEEYDKKLQEQGALREREKVKKEAEIEAIEKLREQEEYNRKLQDIGSLKKQKEYAIRSQQEILDPKIEIDKKIEVDIEEPESIPKSINENYIKITISEYESLKSDSKKLNDISRLWNQAKRMIDSAIHSDSFADRNKEIREAQKVRQSAIDLIDSTK